MLPTRLIVVSLFVSVALVAATAAPNQRRIDTVSAQLEATRAQGQRWARLIETQRELGQHPDKFAWAADEAARDLKANGYEMAFEGLSGGLSSFLKLNAAYTRSKKVKEGLELAANNVEEFYTLAIKDHVKADDPDHWKPSAQVKDTIEKSHAALNFLVIDGLPKGPVRDGISGAMEISKGTMGFITAYAENDEVKMNESREALQSMLKGMKDILPTLMNSTAKKPQELEGMLAAMAEGNPRFASVAKMMGTTAIDDATIALSVANFVWGSYTVAYGFDLQAQAEEIRENQADANLKLLRLLPRARRELARALAEQERLEAELATLTGGKRPIVVRPSQRYIDDGERQPVHRTPLPDASTAIQHIPPLQFSLTADAIERSLTDFRETTQREIEEKKRQLAEERAARERARRIAEENERWARERAEEAEERRGSSRSSGGSSYSSGRESSGSSSGSSMPRSIPNVGTSFTGATGATLFN